MKKFSKIVAGVLFATITMLCAGVSAEQTKVKDPNVYGYLPFAQDVEEITEKMQADGYMPPIYFDDLNSMVLALQAKKIDVINEIPEPVAEYICNHNQNLKSVMSYNVEYRGNLFLRMGTMQNNTKVTELLNSAIKELQASGKLDDLQKKYVDGYLQKGKEPKPLAMPKFANAPIIKVAVTGDNPPIDLVTDGTPAGFNVALLAEIAKLKKVNIIPIPMNSGARFISLNKGIVDAIFLIDETIYNDAKLTELYHSVDIPENICVTDAYAKYPIRDVMRK